MRNIDNMPITDLFAWYAASKDDYNRLAAAVRLLDRMSEPDRQTMLDAFDTTGRINGAGKGLPDCLALTAVSMDTARQAAIKPAA
ncbi:hypothetical protein [Bifidobacterium animalis]|uniref:hypothetical protein n=1 Tax=Bifidobacterium animalis TaxID=28025 RepID=UPI001C3EAFC6|nr:hypothetical protein [Bifidobacterium animalis]MCR1995076.1 hypothetical protein [Bifidobacterium animalis subsp. animalis]